METPNKGVVPRVRAAEPTAEPIDDVMDGPKLEMLLNDLFVANFAYREGMHLSPVMDDATAARFLRGESEKKKKAKELYEAFIEVKKAIERDGGISEETYEAHKYAINSLARDLVKQRWWGSALSHRCEQEDRDGKKATPEEILRFPEDHEYREDRYGHTNIRDKDFDQSGFEGTLFQTRYDDHGNLKLFRIFHQGHRNALHIKTVNLGDLMKKIDEFVEGYKEEPLGSALGFTLDRDAYLQRAEEFNRRFGRFVRVEVLDGSVLVKFPLNPKALAEKFVELAGGGSGMVLQSRMGQITYTVSDTAPDKYDFADLFLPSHMDRSGSRSERFDPEKNADSPTYISPAANPQFSHALIRMYLNSLPNDAS